MKINEEARDRFYVHGNDGKGRATLEYIRRITADAGLNAGYRWDGDEVVVEEN